jgi:predicted nucleic acid-binding protein
VIVVLDTNVWISALVFAQRRGTPTRALEKAMSEDVIASCPEIEAEILRVLTEKFLWEPTRLCRSGSRIGARNPRETSWDREGMPRSKRRYVP